jgi:entericidin A
MPGKRTMKKAAALALVALVLSGCNTISGFGRDVQKVGQVVTGAGGK